MRVIYKGKNTTLTRSVKKYLQEKLIRPAQKLLGTKGRNDDLAILEIELSRTTRHHLKGNVWMAEANLTLGKRVIRAEHVGESPYQVVDLVEEDLTREIKSFKEKNKARALRNARKLKKLLRKGSF